MTPDMAWRYREGRRKRYEGQRIGGTVVVHFIKKNMWFLETAAALLQGEDVTPLERALERRPQVESADPPPLEDRDAEGGSLPPVARDEADAWMPAGLDSADIDSDPERTTTRTRTRTVIRRERRDRGH